jgi:hypothetical protein
MEINFKNKEKKMYWQSFLAQKMINQEEQEDVEDFRCLGSVMNNENRLKLNPGLPRQNQHLKRRILLRQEI